MEQMKIEQCYKEEKVKIEERRKKEEKTCGP